MLIYHQPDDYWHLAPAAPEGFWVEHFDLRLIVGDIRLKNRRDRAEDSPEGDSGGARTASGYDLNDDIPF